jgi:Methyltransferase domain
MRALQKASKLFNRVLGAAKRAFRRARLPDLARRLSIPPGVAACNVCGFVAVEGHPRLCPRCGAYPRQRSFKQLFLDRLQAEIFGRGPLADGLLLSPGEVERALLFPQLRRHVVSSLYQEYRALDSFVRADVRDLTPFADQSFDYVQACNVLDYVPEMAQALRAIHRVLRPAGVFVLLIPEGNLVRDREPISVSIRPSVTGSYWPDPKGVPFVRVGRQTLRDMLEQTGFKPEEVRLREPLSQQQYTWWLCRRR